MIGCATVRGNGALIRMIDGMIADYFSLLYKTEGCSSEEVLACIEPSITEDQNTMLLALFLASDVKDACCKNFIELASV